LLFSDQAQILHRILLEKDIENLSITIYILQELISYLLKAQH